VTVTPSTKGLRKVSNVDVDQETIWQVVRRYPSAGLAEFALRCHNELHRRAAARRATTSGRVFTPNKGNQAIKPEAVVLHHSATAATGAAVEWIASPASKVSYHVLIARDGRRTVFCATIPNAPGTPERATGSAGQDLN
jgi:hypothetical protein